MALRGIYHPTGAYRVVITDTAGDDITSFGGGTQYTEGDTDATITGTAILWEDAGNTLRPVASGTPLPVNIVSGAAAGTEYTEGDTDATITGTAALMEGAGNTLLPIQGTVADGLLVNLGTNNDITVASLPLPTGASTSAKQDTAQTALDAIKTAVELIDNTVAGTELQVDVLTMPVVAVTQSGTWDEVGIHDSGNSITVDGTVTANLAAGTNNIGDVDVLSIAAGTNAIGRIGHDTTGLGHGVTTVTTAGTDVALAASTACKWVTIQAQTDNTNSIAVGATGVDATVATGNGIILEAGDVVSLPVDNLADVFIDSLVNGEGVRYTYGT